jgi:SAM-dependent methyltransferase
MEEVNEYEVYLKDQREDNIFEHKYQPQGKGWSYKFCDYLKGIIKDFDFHNAKVVDVGCREFYTYDYFLEKFQNKIAGVDICEKGLEFAKHKGVMDLDAHFMHDKLGSESFDLVMAIHSLEHMYDLEKVLKNCFDILKPGGYFYFAIPMPSRNEKRGHWSDIPTPEFMIDLCKASGFKYVKHLSCANFFHNENEMVGLFKKC